MIELAFKNIIKRKTRSILTILGILVTMLLHIVISGIMNTYEKDWKNQLSTMAGRIIVQPKSETGSAAMYTLDAIIKESDGRELLSLNNIDQEKSTMVLYQSIVGTWKPNMAPTVMCVGIEPGKEDVYIPNVDVKGSKYLKDDHEIILGAYAATYYENEQDMKLGGTIMAKGEVFKIIGILPSISSGIDNSMIMSLKNAQDLFVRPGLISTIIVSSQQLNQTEALAKDIESAYPKFVAATTKELQKGANEMLFELKKFMSMISNTIIIAVIFIIMIVMVMAVQERKKEIGTLKAIGASRWKILEMIIAESLTLSLMGGLLALPLSIPFELVMLSEVYTDVSMWIQTLIVVIVLGVFSSLWPAWRAQRVDPLESLRYE